MRSALSAYGREPDRDGRSLAFLEQMCDGEILQAVGTFKVTVRAGSFGMNHPLRNSEYQRTLPCWRLSLLTCVQPYSPFAVEMRQ